MKNGNSNSIADFFSTKSAPLKNDPTHYRVYFGTTAKDPFRGIYMAVLDTHTGQLSTASRVSDSVRPGFIEIHPDGKTLYATEASGSFSKHLKGAVSSYKITEPNGTLINLDNQPSGGLGPCHLSIDPRGKHLFVANYHEGSCAVLPILPDHSIGEPVSIHQHSGSSTHLERQTAAHTHSINCDRDGQFALVADLGMDQILIYRQDSLTGHLTPNDPPFIQTAPGDGPRHLTFHPSGKYLYVCMELSNTVRVYEYDCKYGTLIELQTLSTLPHEFSGENLTSEILASKNGKFLYVGNRGHNSIAIFSIDLETGTLTPIGYKPTRGDHPRNFALDPTGKFLLVANANSDTVVVFRIDEPSGKLHFTGHEIKVPHATCIRFAPISNQTDPNCPSCRE